MLQKGMSRDQVKALLGTPLLTDMFHHDRWDYVFTFRRGPSVIVEQRDLTVYFNGDSLDHWTAPKTCRANRNCSPRSTATTRPAICCGSNARRRLMPPQPRPPRRGWPRRRKSPRAGCASGVLRRNVAAANAANAATSIDTPPPPRPKADAERFADSPADDRRQCPAAAGAAADQPPAAAAATYQSPTQPDGSSGLDTRAQRQRRGARRRAAVRGTAVCRSARKR